ncbi:MAG: ATP-binding cassette domain-containing protein [Microcoleus sp. PH2017_40_RAT_O_B]|uniref:ABC transporter ATP-binding protein n=1 Tax=unclassified Microcoleus TaxID=2642155 RepID=UPI001D8DCD7A|nr:MULTISPECIES: ATP-binding cassette domain-containing protein [unclassified Microcoleus]MCC3470029.1 ATP-binding cassette domain-containing protein [Microcoleus sp. PH2017_06_SFM_O_A]MCC3573663.1 ATP-binding cassette domain-containing protein [Microcoleus sp. PH2017_34_RAT_O_A]MCC3587522.1 ATP-binding cassette domain-containing protein [Microcoleus sp. PH2017_30_WIL_O_A]MCC3592246.1 ATP-binding cassette domain-containing protein [Microcoleus sp. PH2017_28_MFU_U_A]MCC3611490.1 ATP-binding cas
MPNYSENYPETTPQLRVDGVSFKTPIASSYLLDNISFQVQKGSRVAIVGPSGAGKTTLLRLLNRLSSPTTGSIYLENTDYRQIGAIELRRQITLVMQESKLLGMSVREALAYPLKLRGVNSSEIGDRISGVIQQLHIPEEWLNRTELQLSTGQKQLVAIARAIVLEPKILLLDEPTSALDAGKAAYLVQVLQELSNSQTTILMVNHQLELAQEFATRVLYLQQGRLLENAMCDRINWEEMRQNLIQAEAQAEQEW